MAILGADLVARIGREIDKKSLKRTDLYRIVPSGTLSNWKNKCQEPSAYTLYKVAQFVGSSVDYLLTGKNPADLPDEEQGLLDSFRLLDSRDKEDILDNIQQKIDRAKRGDILSNSAGA